MYRKREGRLEVLLVHPRRTILEKQGSGAWFVPKGEIDSGEDRTGSGATRISGRNGFDPQGPVFFAWQRETQRWQDGGAWAFAGDCDTATIKSNTFEMEWPPKSGKRVKLPEVDRAEFFTAEAQGKNARGGIRIHRPAGESLEGKRNSIVFRGPIRLGTGLACTERQTIEAASYRSGSAATPDPPAQHQAGAAEQADPNYPSPK